LRKKLNDSKKAVEDMNKLKASERKEERRQFDEFAQNVRLQTEMEKRKKAEEVKRRCVLWGMGWMDVVGVSHRSFLFVFG
jgi:hypothetical protein